MRAAVETCVGGVTGFDCRFMLETPSCDGGESFGGDVISFVSFAFAVNLLLDFSPVEDDLEGKPSLAVIEAVLKAEVAPELVLLVPSNARGDGPRLPDEGDFLLLPLLLLLALRGLFLLVPLRGVLPAELLVGVVVVVSTNRLRAVVLRAHGLPDAGGVVDVFFFK